MDLTGRSGGDCAAVTVIWCDDRDDSDGMELEWRARGGVRAVAPPPPGGSSGGTTGASPLAIEGERRGEVVVE